MIISVINHTAGQVSDEEVQKAVRAINRQIREDYEPYWHIGGELRLEGKSGAKPSKQNLSDMRGDAVLYLWNSVDVDDALGYHDANNRGIPYGFVFTELAKQLGEDWSVTLSHEAIEMLGDSEVNLLVQDPHPADPDRTVFHWYEMCDAVQTEIYEIDGVAVSNFVLPLYFTGGDEKGGRNDFLGRSYKGKTLRSFGVNPGGYVGFFDPEKGDHDTFSAKGDGVATRRMALKFRARSARRGIRYQRYARQPKRPTVKRR
ncbi:MAG: hypothetical protein HXY51_15015 [Nitrospirae bacterium]|nr:hypothetical protein [Nitrospirota bacterium]